MDAVRSMTLGRGGGGADPNAPSAELYQTLDELVGRRCQTLAYQKRLHSGRAFYMSTALISSDALVTLYDTKAAKKRTWQWFYLGLSIGALLPLQDPIEFIKSMNALILEYENETEAKQRGKPIFQSKPKGGAGAATNFLETGVYTYFETPHLPFELDYGYTFQALCDVLISMYGKFVNNTEMVCNQTYMDAVMKVDAKVKKIITIVQKDLDSLARVEVKAEIASLQLY
ncbi:hypothetical protein DFJ73DRAFT_825179 [Zopfochytrium polystomum]|nr:hypothetical protein DFJ73DRAFT_825179 [Zopfochytrium polystomum]